MVLCTKAALRSSTLGPKINDEKVWWFAQMCMIDEARCENPRRGCQFQGITHPLDGGLTHPYQGSPRHCQALFSLAWCGKWEKWHALLILVEKDVKEQLKTWMFVGCWLDSWERFHVAVWLPKPWRQTMRRLSKWIGGLCRMRIHPCLEISRMPVLLVTWTQKAVGLLHYVHNNMKKKRRRSRR